MLLTLSTTHRPASDLGYLLHKHPDRLQSFDLSFGKANQIRKPLVFKGLSFSPDTSCP
jgi:hypothetical protein